MRYIGKIFLLLIVVCLASCQKNGNEEEKEIEQEDPVVPINYNLNPEKILRLVNELRAAGCKCGDTNKPPVPELKWNDRLAKAAYLHCVDMKTHHIFDHTSSDGRKASDRITAAGYNYATYGENIARNYTNEDAVIKAWITSSGHCSNLMSKDYTNIGAGRDGAYWTMVLARPASNSGK